MSWASCGNFARRYSTMSVDAAAKRKAKLAPLPNCQECGEPCERRGKRYCKPCSSLVYTRRARERQEAARAAKRQNK